MKKARFSTIASAAIIALSGAGFAAQPTFASEQAAAQPTAEAAHEHRHGHGEHTLELDDGRKWATDAPLRQGMNGIAGAVGSRLDRVHANTMSDADYDALGKQIDTELAYIVANCELPADADEVLHVLLADLMHGNEVVQGKAEAPRSDGVAVVVDALGKYGEYFDHPGWKAPGDAH